METKLGEIKSKYEGDIKAVEENAANLKQNETIYKKMQPNYKKMQPNYKKKNKK